MTKRKVMLSSVAANQPSERKMDAKLGTSENAATTVGFGSSRVNTSAMKPSYKKFVTSPRLKDLTSRFFKTLCSPRNFAVGKGFGSLLPLHQTCTNTLFRLRLSCQLI